MTDPSSTVLIASLAASEVRALAADLAEAGQLGARWIELRLDPFDGDVDELAGLLIASPGTQWIFTCRGVREGGRSPLPAEERIRPWLSLATAVGAHVDVEWEDYRTRADLRALLRPWAAPFNRSGREGPRLILSTHRLDGHPLDARSLIRDIRASAPGAIPKAAWMSGGAFDWMEALALLRDDRASRCAGDSPPIIIAMGERGGPSRLLARKFGAFGCYAPIRRDAATAPGQTTFEEMIRIYRWNDMDSKTRVYGVAGDPVRHSIGPVLMNRWCRMRGINAVYVPFLVPRESRLSHWLASLLERPWLDVEGLSVTLPHKSAAFRACEEVDAAARRSGSVNTLTRREGGWAGRDTDGMAVVECLGAALGQSPDRSGPFEGLEVAVLGAGGAARAAVAALSAQGCRLTVYARDLEAAQRLGREFGGLAATWADLEKGRGDVLINATPVGLWPKEDESPASPIALGRWSLVFDMVYHPERTLLIAQAEAAGVRILGGLEMFIRQAALQMETWFGGSPELSDLRPWAREGLAQRARSGGRPSQDST